MLGRTKTYSYLVDKLSLENAEILKNAIRAIPSVTEVQIKVKAGLVEVTSKKDVEEEVALACGIAKCVFRTKVSSRQANYHS